MGRNQKYFVIAVIALFASGAAEVAKSADEVAANFEAERALRRAIADLAALKSIPEVHALVAKNAAVSNQVDTIQRSLASAGREVYWQMRYATVGNARDTAFHAISLTRELAKLASLETVKPDLDALVRSSPVYQQQKDQWQQLYNDSQREIDRNVARYLNKLTDLKKFCQKFCNVAFDDLRQQNGQTDLGRQVVDLIHKHVTSKAILSRDEVLSDFRSVLQTTQ